MQELSMNVLDIAENSVKAGASLIEITLTLDRAASRLTLCVKDNGCGMSEELAARVTDPFCTSRTFTGSHPGAETVSTPSLCWSGLLPVST